MLTANHKRLITALVLLLILAGIAYLGGLAVRVALFGVAVLALNEFYSFFWPAGEHSDVKLIALIAAGLLLLLPNPLYAAYLPYILTITFCLLAGAFLVRFSISGQDTSNNAFMIAAGGIIYIPVSLRFFLHFTPAEVMLVLAGAICTDSAAFYIGSWAGKRPIWPAISPKKTWAGSVAGLAACVLVTLVIGLFRGQAPLWQFALLGIILNIAAQMGDFFESALKRHSHIKDSGKLLPGHGGILDRIDSLLFLLPVYATLGRLIRFF